MFSQVEGIQLETERRLRREFANIDSDVLLVLSLDCCLTGYWSCCCWNQYEPGGIWLRDHLQRNLWIQLNLRLCSDDVFLQMEARGGYFAQKRRSRPALAASQFRLLSRGWGWAGGRAGQLGSMRPPSASSTPPSRDRGSLDQISKFVKFWVWKSLTLHKKSDCWFLALCGERRIGDQYSICRRQLLRLSKIFSELINKAIWL